MPPIWLIVIFAAAILLIIFIWGSYNSLVKLNERVNEAWSGITVQLKYRADLVPNLVEIVKGYAKHEKSTFEEVISARSKIMTAQSVKSTAEAEKGMETALGKIFALAESYPELKANENYRELQIQLQDVEDKIQAARRFYNSGVSSLNMKVKLFPINLFNGFGFKTRDYYEVSEEESAKIQNAPEIKM